MHCSEILSKLKMHKVYKVRHITRGYMTYFRLQSSSRLCLAFQLAADLRMLVPSADHMRIQLGASLLKCFLAFGLFQSNNMAISLEFNTVKPIYIFLILL